MNSQDTTAEAVFVFTENELSREMLYTEFEAILDGFIPLTEFANQQIRAVYVRVVKGFYLKAAVFFRIGFDSQGLADSRWNVPLEQLADISAKGPDLGAGPIRLACLTQCAIAWHQQKLWQPEQECFNSIRLALKRNRLGLAFAETVPTEPSLQVHSQPTLSSSFSAIHPDSDEQGSWRAQETEALARDALLQKAETKQYVMSLADKHRKSVNVLKKKHFQEVENLHNQIRKLQQQLAAAIQQASELSEERLLHLEKIEGLQEYFNCKLGNLKTLDEGNLQQLKSQMHEEKTQALAQLERETQAQLKEKDTAISQLIRERAELSNEVLVLKADNAQLLNDSGQGYLNKLHQAGVSLGSFQLGAGHITLPVDDVPIFMEDREGYVAQRCGVSKRHFQRWLVHFHNPNCTHNVGSDYSCQRGLVRIDRPGLFVEGTSDRCELHKEYHTALASQRVS